MKERLIARLVMLALGGEQVISGVWAVFDPSGWFRNFPGFGRRWVALEGVFDHHLATDAGAGWLGVGVALLVSAVWGKREAMQIALLAFVVEVVPHFLFHATHPSARLPMVDRLFSTGGLGLMAAVAVIVLIEITWRRTPRTGGVWVTEEVSA